ncbi:helix-turn-helix domain-containing protein, partial [Solihabitans fulvus]|uniref:helix-turn-helix domain-containing protein n=1 Tax=Solihabitans fulvus TaxID=1892852 RepID=UPI001661A9B2
MAQEDGATTTPPAVLDGDEVPLTFGAALRQRREALRPTVSLRAMAKEIHFDKSQVSRIENGQLPTPEFAQAVDTYLAAGGALVALADQARARRHPSTQAAQLPAAPNNFVGRDLQLGRLHALLAEATAPGAMAVTVVCLDGPPGVGKTALALRWAHEIQDQFDGVLFANLRGFSAGAPAAPHQVLEELLGGLGISPDQVPADPAVRAGLFRSLLHDQRFLLVLDNAADSQQVRPLLPGMPNCVVLVTSRQRLAGLAIDPGARAVTLNPLDRGEAVTLVGSVIGDQRAAADPAAVAALVQRCAYLPLAVRIAAERVASHPHQTVADLVADLASESDRLELLSAADDDTMAVRAAFSWSYRALEPDAARMFRLLG